MKSPARRTQTTKPPPVLIPRLAVVRPNAWKVPVEMVMACTTSRMRDVIRARQAADDAPMPEAEVVLRGKRFFATVSYTCSRPDLFLPLDVWPWENGRAAP